MAVAQHSSCPFSRKQGNTRLHQPLCFVTDNLVGSRRHRPVLHASRCRQGKQQPPDVAAFPPTLCRCLASTHTRILDHQASAALDVQHHSVVDAAEPAACPHMDAMHPHRRQALALSVAAVAALGPLMFPQQAAAIKCPRLTGYALSKCLREERKARSESGGDVEDERAKLQQYEQPGVLVKMPSGNEKADGSFGNSASRLSGAPQAAC